MMTGVTSKALPILSKTLTITEEELRAFTRCSEFKHRGGLIELPLRTAVVEFAYIKLVLSMLRNQSFEYKYELNTVLRQALNHISKSGELSPSDRSDFIRTAALGVHEIFKILPPQLYIPIFGPFEYPVKVSNTISTMRVSSILTTKRSLNQKNVLEKDPDYRNRTVHAVAFSPFSSTLDIENDLVQQVKALTLGSANPTRLHKDRPTVRLHLFSATTAGPSHGVGYTFIEHRTPVDYKSWASYLEQPIKLYESQYHYPITPCHYGCPFKATCQPSPFRKGVA